MHPPRFRPLADLPTAASNSIDRHEMLMNRRDTLRVTSAGGLP